MSLPTIDEELLALAYLRDAKDATKEAAEAAKDEFDRHQRTLIERAEAENIQGLKAHGMTFSFNKPTHYGTIQDRSEFVAWAQENDAELVETKERAALLNALVRARLDNGEPLPPGVGFYSRQHISMRES